MNLLTDPTNLTLWKNHFLNMARNKICGKGRRVVVKHIPDSDDKPIVSMVSPTQQTLRMAKSEIKGSGKRVGSQLTTSSPPKRKKKTKTGSSAQAKSRKRSSHVKEKVTKKKSSRKRVVRTRKRK